ncbi:bifunctional DNA primase/polymerase, partial [Granulicoccus phenolivorans]|uniref:bifunctional DNA primase/polymerase n=1 Tax=Granulicoccus phenolivorans TaxID=266854 RepID=UPI00138AE5D8
MRQADTSYTFSRIPDGPQNVERVYNNVRVDRSGANMRLDSWHAISNLENEYHVPGRDAYSPWNDQLRVECAKKTERVRHGVKFTDRAFIRFNGQMADIDSSSPYFSEPFEVTLDVRFDDGLAGQAVQFLRDVTVDDKSGMNLCRMFATPLLEPYKHLTYVLYGDGGNGKGILLNTLAASLPGLTASVDSQKILGGRRGSGGFDTQQEMGKLIGALWAFDEDADTISLEQLTALKKISTGDSVTARRIQENAVSFAPRCTFIVATNNPVITTMSNAIARRFVYVRMKDGRKPSEFASLLEFRRQYGVAPFLMASCLTWLQHGDDPYYDVSVGSASDLSEAEQWLVDMICEQGYAVSRDNPYSESAREHKSSISKLGLKSGYRWKDNSSIRVLVVADERRFKPYREAWEKDQKQLEEASKPLPVPGPIESTGRISLSEFGFHADYVPARQDKSALNWKKQAENPAIDTSRIPDTAAYAVIPQAGYMVIDMDKAKAEGEQDGWQSLQLSVGQYGSSEFPRTYLVTTPSGGVHAYYKMPQGLSGHILNKVKAGGHNIDLRVDGLGYVIGAGSTTSGGVYEV